MSAWKEMRLAHEAYDRGEMTEEDVKEREFDWKIQCRMDWESDMRAEDREWEMWDDE